MTLAELSLCYEAAAVPLRKRLRELRQMLAQTDDAEEVFHIKRRIAELTPIQREIMLAYYFEEKSITQIALERNIHKSTACRTLHRAEKRLKRYLTY